ncbi:MAG TPA: FkbM family methyltransferase [Fibrobacteres bacterium]|jgi:FkbM family methyltransferase|nr:FkbM family methyltransferase [Fibrobacterota bacterium]
MKKYFFFRMADKLYNYAFPLYYPMYVFYKNIHDFNEMEIIRHHVKSGFTVIDIGANIGVITRLLAGLVGQTGHVHAFEPDLRNFAHLSRLTGLPNVKTNNAAIGDKDGTIDLYVSEDMNVDHRTYPVDEKRERTSVECFAVDSYIKDKPVDFIKMDIQGYEYKALCGMRKTVSAGSCKAILMELWPYGLEKAGSTVSQVMDLLVECGFYPQLLYRGELVAFSENLIENKETKVYTLLAEKTV